jgi:hypothetical protein
MKRGRQIDTWYPFYIDKWLFGSTRHELVITPGWAERFPELVAAVPKSIIGRPFTDLRGIFVDLMTLSKKDGGYIRANEDTPYPVEQLAGMFCVPADHVRAAIGICVHKRVGKLSEPSPGIYYVESTEAYSLSDRWKREKMLGLGECSGISEQGSKKREAGSKKADPILNKNKGNKIKEENTRDGRIQDEFDPLFEEFWGGYPKKIAKDYAREKFMILARTGKIPELMKATKGYMDFLKHKLVHEKFKQTPLNPATFLTKNRWRDYIDFKYEPPG